MELDYLWVFYNRLSRRRQSGMSSNPLTYTELEAFERKALVTFRAWETDLLMRIDDAVLAAWSGKNKPVRTPTNGGVEYAANDIVNLREMVRSRALATKLARENEAKMQAGKGPRRTA